MPAKRSLTLALAVLLVAAIPARATGFPTITVVDEIRPGGDSSQPMWSTGRLGDWLYFPADDGSTGSELWRTNGTVTTQAADINNDGYSNPAEFTEFNGYLYFQAEDGTDGTELWRTNGSAVEQVRNITAGGGSSYPELFTVLGDYLYFRTSNLSFYELWRTDGTTAGTTMVEDIIPDESQTLWGLTALGDYLYFVASSETTYQIYRTNTAGLMEVGVVPGTASGVGCECSRPLVALDGRLFMQMFSDEASGEFAYLDEPTFVLPETNRDGSVWSTALVLLAAVTAVAGVGLRMRGVRHVASEGSRVGGLSP